EPAEAAASETPDQKAETPEPETVQPEAVEPAAAAPVKQDEPVQEPAAATEAAPQEESRPARNEDRERARRAAEAEAAALRQMLSRPRKVLKAPEPEQPGLSGTLHKPAGKSAAKKEGKAGEVKKTVKGSEVSTAWSDDSGRKKPAARADAAPSSPSRDGWRASGKSGKGTRGGRNKQAQAERKEPQVAEFIAREVHVPETITVADLAHKMTVKAAEVIKHLMKLGQMVTINQVLDQETAMIVVEELGHTAIAAKLDDPEAFL